MTLGPYVLPRGGDEPQGWEETLVDRMVLRQRSRRNAIVRDLMALRISRPIFIQ